MPNQDLQNYISQARSAGKNDEMIKQDLRSSGWQETDITQAFGVNNTITMAPTTTNKHSWLKILGVIFLVLIAIFGAIAGFAWWANAAPSRIAKQFITDLSQGKTIDAYGLTSTDFKSATSENKMELFVANYPEVKNINDITFSDRQRVNDSAEMKGTVSTSSGKTYPVEVKLKQEGDWRVYNFKITFGSPTSSQTNTQSPTPTQENSNISSGNTHIGNCAATSQMQPGKSAGFPSDIPVYSGSQLLGYVGKQTFYCAADSIDAVKSFFLSAQSNWKISAAPFGNTPDFASLIAQNSGQTVFITVGKNGQNNTTTISYTLNK